VAKPVYKRVLLKLSGEAFAGESGFGIDPKVVNGIAEELREVFEMGVELAVVVGGGNIFRARSSGPYGIERVFDQVQSGRIDPVRVLDKPKYRLSAGQRCQLFDQYRARALPSLLRRPFPHCIA